MISRYISSGIHDIEAAIVRRKNEGYRAAASWYAEFPCKVVSLQDFADTVGRVSAYQGIMKMLTL